MKAEGFRDRFVVLFPSEAVFVKFLYLQINSHFKINPLKPELNPIY